MIWPVFLVFDLTGPIHQRSLNINKANFQLNFQDVWSDKVVLSGHKILKQFDLVNTHQCTFLSIFKEFGLKMKPLECSHGFFYDLILWLSFWLHMIHIWRESRNHQGKHSDQFQTVWVRECSRAFFSVLTCWPSLLTNLYM